MTLLGVFDRRRQDVARASWCRTGRASRSDPPMLPGTTAAFMPALSVSGVISGDLEPLRRRAGHRQRMTWPVFLSNSVAKPLPAMLELCGSTTLSTAATATAASKALPPSSRMREPGHRRQRMRRRHEAVHAGHRGPHRLHRSPARWHRRDPVRGRQTRPPSPRQLSNSRT